MHTYQGRPFVAGRPCPSSRYAPQSCQFLCGRIFGSPFRTRGGSVNVAEVLVSPQRTLQLEYLTFLMTILLAVELRPLVTLHRQVWWRLCILLFCNYSYWQNENGRDEFQLSHLLRNLHTSDDALVSHMPPACMRSQSTKEGNVRMLEVEHQKRRPAVLALSVFMACFVCSRRRPVGSVWARARDICLEHSDGLLMVVCNIYIGSYDMVCRL